MEQSVKGFEKAAIRPWRETISISKNRKHNVEAAVD